MPPPCHTNEWEWSNHWWRSCNWVSTLTVLLTTFIWTSHFQFHIVLYDVVFFSEWLFTFFLASKDFTVSCCWNLLLYLVSKGQLRPLGPLGTFWGPLGLHWTTQDTLWPTRNLQNFLRTLSTPLDTIGLHRTPLWNPLRPFGLPQNPLGLLGLWKL